MLKIFIPGMIDELKVWAQMFFDDGSVTQGHYVSAIMFQEQGYIDLIAKDLLDDTKRKEGVLLIWGAGQVFGKKVKLVTAKSGLYKGEEVIKYNRI